MAMNNDFVSKMLARLGNTRTLYGDGAMTVGKQPKKELPPIAKKFRRLLKARGWTPTRLADEAGKKFGADAATPQSFRRLIGFKAPTSETAKVVIQAEEILFDADDQPKLALEHMAETEPTAAAIVPLINHIPAARDATEEQIVAESRKLMNSRHASLHALLTLLLANK